MEKMTTITACTCPKTKKRKKEKKKRDAVVLGLTGYYHWFVLNFVELTSP